MILTDQLRQSLVDLIERDQYLILDETAFHLSPDFNDNIRQSRYPSKLDQLLLIEEKRYLELFLELIRGKEKILIPEDVAEGLENYSRHLGMNINYFLSRGHRGLRKHKDKVNLLRKIRGDIDRIRNVSYDYVPPLDKGLYSLIKNCIIILGKERGLKKVSEKSHKKVHNRENVDEGVVALAIYTTMYEDKSPIIMSNDTDIFRLTRDAYICFFNSGFESTGFRNLRQNRICIYSFLNPDYVYRESYNTQEIFKRPIELAEEARRCIDHNIYLLNNLSQRVLSDGNKVPQSLVVE